MKQYSIYFHINKFSSESSYLCPFNDVKFYFFAIPYASQVFAWVVLDNGCLLIHTYNVSHEKEIYFFENRKK